VAASHCGLVVSAPTFAPEAAACLLCGAQLHCYCDENHFHSYTCGVQAVQACTKPCSKASSCWSSTTTAVLHYSGSLQAIMCAACNTLFQHVGFCIMIYVELVNCARTLTSCSGTLDTNLLHTAQKCALPLFCVFTHIHYLLNRKDALSVRIIAQEVAPVHLRRRFRFPRLPTW
jgi:hypothetical protein